MANDVIAYWCLLGAGLMPYVIVAIAKATRDYDNADPRNLESYRTPLRRRARAAHDNALEAFPFFAIAVLLATRRDAPAGTIDALAIGWVVLRLIYTWTYLKDYSTARSLVWFAASFVTIAIFLTALLN